MDYSTYSIYPVAEFGDFIVYRRGPWHRRERLPGYVVFLKSSGRAIEEFRRKKSALQWARQEGGGA